MTSEPNSFDPSRVTAVVEHDGLTCIHFLGGVLTLSGNGGVYRIISGTNAWFFEWSDRWGALRVGPRGETREQPDWGSHFWTATAIWARQGKRTQRIGRHIIAMWEQPPAATHYWAKSGRQKVVIRSDEPDGYDPFYSKERFVECDSDGPRKAETNEDSARGEAGPARAEGIARKEVP